MAHVSGFYIHHHQLSVSLLQGIVHGLPQTLKVFCLHFQPVHDKLDRVVAVSVKLQPVGKFPQFTVYTHIQVAFLAQVLEKLLVMSLSVFDKRSKHINLFPVIFFSYKVNDFVLAVFHHRQAGNVASCLTEAGVKQAEKIVYFSGGAYCGTRILVYRLLFYADYG